MLETSVCRMEYAIAKKHPVIGVVLPTCEALPSAGSKDSANCLRLGVPNVVQVVHGMCTVMNPRLVVCWWQSASGTRASSLTSQRALRLIFLTPTHVLRPSSHILSLPLFLSRTYMLPW